MSEEPKVLTVVPDEVEQNEEIRDATKVALRVLRTKTLRGFVLVALEDNEGGTNHIVVGKGGGLDGVTLVGAIEQMKHSYLQTLLEDG